MPSRTDAFAERVHRLAGQIDGEWALDTWNAVLTVPQWTGPALWLHGDMHPGNPLVHGGRLSAVIDFGDLTAGDPANDLAVAWMMLPLHLRTRFR